MGIFLDFAKDMMNLNEHHINLQCRSTGHYCVLVSKNLPDSPKVNVLLLHETMCKTTKDIKCELDMTLA